MNIQRLLGNRLLVSPIKPKQKTSGIVLPDSALDDNNVGGPKVYKVLMTGPGLRKDDGTYTPMEVDVGDTIVCQSYTTGPSDLENGQKILTADQVLVKLPAGTV